MTDYWATIKERLHEESGLHHKNNQMALILESYINGILNTLQNDNQELVDQGFLLTSSGLYLDIRGEELALPRKEGDYATGTITFALTQETTQETQPQLTDNTIIENNNGSLTFNYIPENIQELINQINTQRKETGEPILTLRKCTSDFTIPRGTLLSSETGFEYILQEDVIFPEGETNVSGLIKALESGERYNTSEHTINIVTSADSINSDLICTNISSLINGVDGESDGDYRLRLLNSINTNISVNYLKRQNIIIYSKKELNDSCRLQMTSFNPYLSNMYCAIPPNEEVSDFVNHELIANQNIKNYIKGWK